MIINRKKYEKIVKYFFFIFWVKLISEMNLSTLQNTLNQLKRNGIFDYESNSHWYRVFISIYEKKETIDLLISKRNSDIKNLENELKNKLDINNIIITNKDIDNTI